MAVGDFAGDVDAELQLEQLLGGSDEALDQSS